MLYSVRGKLIAIESNAAVVECGGVGYMCQTTMNTLKAVKLNTEVTLYTWRLPPMTSKQLQEHRE